MTMGMRVTRTLVLVVFLVIVQGFKVTEGNSLKAVTDTTTTTPIKCENGGLPDGIKCICPGNVHGVRCELVRDRVFLGRSLDATIRVELSVTEITYSNDLNIVSSPSHVLLNTTLTALEKNILPNYFQGIKITNVQNAIGGIVVIHDVIIRISFKRNESVAVQYATNYKEVETKLRTAKNCTNVNSQAMCIKELTGITANIPPTEKELCLKTISEFFVSYFDAVVEEDGLSCISQCDLASESKIDCNEGTCQIQKDGPECFCPNTDKYLYTYSKCRGAVLIVAMYGGVGAAVAVLVITSVILGVYFYRKKYYY